MNRGYGCSIWNKLIKRELAKKHSFNQEIAIAEDFLFLVEILLDAKVIYFESKNLYNYFYREDSAYHQTKDPSRFIKCLKGLQLTREKLNDYKDFYNCLNYHIYVSGVNYLYILYEDGDNEVYKEIDSIVKNIKHAKPYKRDLLIYIKRKILYFLVNKGFRKDLVKNIKDIKR